MPGVFLYFREGFQATEKSMPWVEPQAAGKQICEQLSRWFYYLGEEGTQIRPIEACSILVPNVGETGVTIGVVFRLVWLNIEGIDGFD